jgi:hypothetical protein
MKNVFLISLIIFGLNLTTNGQSSKKEEKELKKEENYQSMLKLINTEHYGFRGSKAKPQKGPQIDLTTRGNQLIIDNGNAAADLPYFGRAYSGGYSSSDGGIKFDGQMESYDVSKNEKKHKAIIKFKVKGTDDTYSCTLSITGSNSAFLSVICNKKQAISYSGIIHEIGEEKPQE